MTLLSCHIDSPPTQFFRARSFPTGLIIKVREERTIRKDYLGRKRCIPSSLKRRKGKNEVTCLTWGAFFFSLILSGQSHLVIWHWAAPNNSNTHHLQKMWIWMCFLLSNLDITCTLWFLLLLVMVLVILCIYLFIYGSACLEELWEFLSKKF